MAARRADRAATGRATRGVSRATRRVSRGANAGADATTPAHRPEAALAAVRAGLADMELVRQVAGGCRACPLWERATQTVFGTGPVPARLMLVGEQPGDREDRAGEPFVGPAGAMLDRALEDAGIDRESAFVTNVVKHFKWRPARESKRRLHDRPNRTEVGACLPWVESELALVKPEALVLMGATAAEGITGRPITVTRDRGRPLELDLAPLVLVTVHPSSILRAGPGRAAAYEAFVRDLAAVGRWLNGGSAAA